MIANLENIQAEIDKTNKLTEKMGEIKKGITELLLLLNLKNWVCFKEKGKKDKKGSKKAPTTVFKIFPFTLILLEKLFKIFLTFYYRTIIGLTSIIFFILITFLPELWVFFLLVVICVFLIVWPTKFY